jgi:transcriptional regulator with XRE-family HTH domain
MSDETSPDDRTRKIVKRTPEIEIAIGARIRAMRLAVGMSQNALGEALGVSFQQVQKYEKGKDRIAASTLQVLAAALGVHPGSFFDEEMPSPTGELPAVRTALKGAAGLQRISNPRVCKHVVALIHTLADQDGSSTPVSSRTEDSDLS